MKEPALRFYVLYRSSFRYETAPNISHETIDKIRTLCGRKVSDAETFEPDDNDLEPDCIICRKSVAKLKARVRPDVVEAQLKCEDCSGGHRLGALRSGCKVVGCECWCNR